MCGIAGYTGSDPKFLSSMNQSQVHRGPDDGGEYHSQDGSVHLGIRRLAIIDIKTGRQPMSIENGRYWIVYNGEIFNAPELRKKLESKGRVFATDHSDTEVLLHLYATEGERMVDHLNGMFAFVIHDTQKQTLFAARDHFGIKPFLYSLEGGQFAFASEMQALHRLPWIARDIDPQAVSDYLSFQSIPAPQTIYRSVRKLGAGCCCLYGIPSRRFLSRRYYTPPVGHYRHHRLPRERQELLPVVRQEFLNAVGRWSLSDVPVGHSLSGGVDSPAVVAASASLGFPARTFTVGFDDAPNLDERQEALIVSRRWNTDHQEIVLHADDLLGDLDSMIHHLGEPYAGGLPSWFVFRAMKGKVTVAMTGTGGDELFGNYGKWLVHQSMRKRWTRVKTFFRNQGSIADFFSSPRGSLHYPYITDGAKQSLLLPAFRQNNTSSASFIQSLWNQSPDSDIRSRIAFIDLALQLPEEFLFMTDRFSMAHSIEARTPFLDRTFVETIFSILPDLRMQEGNLKGLFIDAMGDLLPRELLLRPKKGFVLPVGRWMRGQLKPLVDRLCGETYVREQQIFSPQAVQASFSEDWKLWTLLSFQLWYEKTVRGNPIHVR